MAGPVGSGFVVRLARPGGNLTGTSMLSPDLAGKRLLLPREVLPKATRVALLVRKRCSAVAQRSSNPSPLLIEQTRAAARRTGTTLVVQQADEAGALAGLFAAMQPERTQALVVQSSPCTQEHRKQIVQRAAQPRLPTMFESRGPVVAGGLMSCGPNQLEITGRTALHADKVFKGAKPADKAMEQPTK